MPPAVQTLRIRARILSCPFCAVHFPLSRLAHPRCAPFETCRDRSFIRSVLHLEHAPAILLPAELNLEQAPANLTRCELRSEHALANLTRGVLRSEHAPVTLLPMCAAF